MDAKQLRTKSVSELKRELQGARQTQLELKKKAMFGTVIKPHEAKLMRRGVARLKTILSELGDKQGVS